MDEWNTEHHTNSGLLDRVREEGISEHAAEVATLDFLREWITAGSAPLWQQRWSGQTIFGALYAYT